MRDEAYQGEPRNLRAPPLGRDFWVFRSGQVISQIGDGCRDIALSWWVLEKTGSAAQVAAVITPSMASRLVLVPLLGPLGDRFQRKYIMAVSDAWRGIAVLLLAWLAALDRFNIVALVAVQVFAAFGTALGDTSSRSIVPQIVATKMVPRAIRVSEIVRATGAILGGLLGGVLTSALDAKVSFLFDAASFIFAAGASISIQTIIFDKKDPSPSGSPFGKWINDVRRGIGLVIANRGLLAIASYAMLLNLVASPLAVALPVLVKESRQMPAWFLGGMDAALGVGSIVGAAVVATLRKRFQAAIVVALGIALVGIGTALLPIVSTISLPIVMALCVGFGITLANLPIMTQVAVVVPDMFRARVDSVIIFLCGLAMPIGSGLSGVAIEKLGLAGTLWGMGFVTILLAPAFVAIPGVSGLMRASGSEYGLANRIGLRHDRSRVEAK